MTVMQTGGSYTATSSPRRSKPDVSLLIEQALLTGQYEGIGANSGWVSTADRVNGEIIIHLAFKGLLAPSAELAPVADDVARHPEILRVRDAHIDHTLRMSVIVAIAAEVSA